MSSLGLKKEPNSPKLYVLVSSEGSIRIKGLNLYNQRFFNPPCGQKMEKEKLLVNDVKPKKRRSLESGSIPFLEILQLVLETENRKVDEKKSHARFCSAAVF